VRDLEAFVRDVNLGEITSYVSASAFDGRGQLGVYWSAHG
jgi:hypothetical protein